MLNLTGYWKELPDGNYQCSCCRIHTTTFYETCPMCEAVMSNYESLLIRAYNLTKDKNYDILSVESEEDSI